MNGETTPEESASTRESYEKTGAPYIEVSGSQATRELRDTSRRRREAEEKLQQHLIEAKEHAHEAEQAHSKAHGSAGDAGDDSGAHETGSKNQDS
jgi:hypothetical protein